MAALHIACMLKGTTDDARDRLVSRLSPSKLSSSLPEDIHCTGYSKHTRSARRMVSTREVQLHEIGNAESVN